jgi:hypothetical protein
MMVSRTNWLRPITFLVAALLATPGFVLASPVPASALGATTADVSGWPNASRVGQNVQITAGVDATLPPGPVPPAFVTFFDGTSALGVALLTPTFGCLPINICPKSYAQINVSSLSEGTHTIRAVFLGDATGNLPSSGSYGQTVVAAPPPTPTRNATVQLSSTPNPSDTFSGVVFTATVVPLAPATVTPDGYVHLVDGAFPFGVSLRVNGFGQAVFLLGTLAPGTHSMTAVYEGDSTYIPGAVSNVVVQVVTRPSPIISTTASAGGPLGTAVSDAAILAGGTTPTGTIAFNLYGPDDATCITAPVFTASATVSGNGPYGSGNFVPAAPGTYRWTASYSGDAKNNPATGACNAPNQSVTVAKASPTISTAASPGNLLGAPVRDTATLAGGSNPTGNVTFGLFSDNACTAQVFTSTNALAGSTATSDWFTPASAGIYYWTALYNGDANNNTATSPCNAPNESVVITPFQAPPYTKTITGDFLGPLTVAAGESVLITAARVVGPVTVNPGGALTTVSSQITRGISANAPGFFSLCATKVAGPTPAPTTALTVTNAAVLIRVGDPASGCAGNQFAGKVVLTANLAVTFGANIVSESATIGNNGAGNTVVKANTLYGALACTGNNPPPTNAGQSNTAGSKSGQCSAL